MKRKAARAAAAAALIVLSAAGCYQSTEVTWYEPGVYKGARDPLLEKLDRPEFRQTLSERVRTVQADR